MKKDLITDVFYSTMKKSGFRKNNTTCYKESNDAILVANLQRSQFGNLYYVNLAVWIKALGETSWPKVYECHFSGMRASSLDSDREEFWEKEAFDLENQSIPEQERIEMIQSFLEKQVVPFLLGCSTVQDLRRLYNEGRFKNYFNLVGRNYLEAE